FSTGTDCGIDVTGGFRLQASPSLAYLQFQERRRRHNRGTTLAVAKIKLVDATGVRADLLDRDEYLSHISPRLPVMLLQLEDTLLQPAHIGHHAADFGMNEVSGFPHAGILQYLLHHLDRQHQKRR